MLTLKIIVQTMQNICNCIVGKSSLQEMANVPRLSRRFHTLIWRPGDVVQNLVLPDYLRELTALYGVPTNGAVDH